ncbi:YfgM family protein [Candidatus Ruminimicrobiellum ovillum]|uniref:YfgM family protein n=1 Tax=Candidatus Ruminimicrobiellum ovillum TaxID=1947927 RepID=UPI003559CBEA
MEMEKQENAAIVELIKWIKRNKKPFFSTLISVIVVALIIVFVYVRIQMVNTAASDKLDMATKIIASGNLDQGLSLIDDVINTYGNTPAAYRAIIIKASNLIFQKKYDEAEANLKTYIEKAKPDTVKPIGYPLLISVYDNNDNVEKAISVSKEFLSKYPDNYLAASVMENMARLYALSGKEEEAKQTYKDITEKFPGTIYSERANDKLK